jgi:hypothetical protein
MVLNDGAAAHTTYPSLRLPEFWADRPQAWFNHLEAECELRNPPITRAATKFHLASTALPASIRTQVSQILDKPPADSYTALKAALLALYVKTPLEDAYQLLQLGELGDQLPTTQYRNMVALWNDDGQAVFKAIFLRSLPQNLQDAIADDDNDTGSLAERADKIIKNRRAAAVNAATGINAVAGTNCTPEQLEINAMTSAIKLKYATGKNINHKPDYNKEKDTTGMCFAHRKYGKDAYSCRGAPCPMAGLTATKPAGKASAGR